MDLKSIGFNYNWINGSTVQEVRRRRGNNKRVESAKEQLRPKDNRTSAENNGKGRVVDVSF